MTVAKLDLPDHDDDSDWVGFFSPRLSMISSSSKLKVNAEFQCRLLSQEILLNSTDNPTTVFLKQAIRVYNPYNVHGNLIVWIRNVKCCKRNNPNVDSEL